MIPGRLASLQRRITTASIKAELSKRRKVLNMRKWECIVCGWVYDEELGDPESGVAPGTAWEDVPDDWMCPDCGVGKEDFEMIEIS